VASVLTFREWNRAWVIGESWKLAGHVEDDNS
jgi:hypothetical protein